MSLGPGVCGWCLTGQCCEDARTFSTFVCTHTERCGMRYEEIRQRIRGWCSAHGRDHRLERCVDINEEGVFMATLVEKAWAQLDAEMDAIAALDAELRESQEGISLGPQETRVVLETLTHTKARARGKAEILLLFMAPHYASVDEIATEASRRKWHRDQGLDYTSPGMGTRRTEGL